MEYLSYQSACEAERDLGELRMARALISRRPLWTQNELIVPSSFDGVPVAAHCSLGAISTAVGLMTHSLVAGVLDIHDSRDTGAKDRYHVLSSILRDSGYFVTERCVNIYHRQERLPCQAVHCFNDHHTHAEVLAAWDAVIADVAVEAARLRSFELASA